MPNHAAEQTNSNTYVQRMHWGRLGIKSLSIAEGYYPDDNRIVVVYDYVEEEDVEIAVAITVRYDRDSNTWTSIISNMILEPKHFSNKARWGEWLGV